HVQEMNRLNDRHVDGEIETGDGLHRVKVEVPGGTEIVGLVERGREPLEVVEAGQIRRPGEIIDLVVLEVAAIRGAIGDQEQRGEEQKEKDAAPFGHEVLW